MQSLIENFKTLAKSCVSIYRKKVSGNKTMEIPKINYWWFFEKKEEALKDTGEELRAFVAKYFVEANYFYLQFLLVDFVLLSALPVMGTEYEMSQDFVPLHALVLTRDFKLFDNIPIDECCQGSTFLQYLCAIGLVSCGK